MVTFVNHNNYFNLFLGKVFGIQGFKNEIKSKIIQLISFCNGFYFETILENTDYVIVPLTFDNSNIIQNKINSALDSTMNLKKEIIYIQNNLEKNLNSNIILLESLSEDLEKEIRS